MTIIRLLDHGVELQRLANSFLSMTIMAASALSGLIWRVIWPASNHA